jgi:nucleotide-binding universal stress UspA family protein
MYGKILVALDGSQPSTRALNHALVLSEKFGSELIILTVFQRRVLPVVAEEADTGELSVDAEVYETYWDSIKDYHIRVLEKAKELMKSDYPNVMYEAVLTEGRPSNEICRTARSHEVDLIVMGNNGRGGITGWVLGSTSKAVVDSCTRPILIVK